MTSNQLRARELNAKREEIVEKKRSNKAQERLKRDENIFKGITAGANVAKVFGSANSPAWYSKNKQLVEDVANISFHTPLGNTYSMGDFVYGGTTNDIQAAPGNLAIPIAYTIGPSHNLGGINIAARNMYAYVRHANSGSTNYESPDLMLYMYYMASNYSVASHMMRIYSLLNEAKAENKYYSYGILKSMGVDYDDLVQHISDFRSLTNRFLTSLSAFNVPKTMPLFDRYTWLVGNIFKDNPIKRSQTYTFYPAFYYLYNETKGKLEPHAFELGDPFLPADEKPLAKFATFKVTVNYILNNILGNESIGIMSGDILKAYGESGLYRLNTISDDFHVESVWSPEILTQINGGRTCGTPHAGATDLVSKTLRERDLNQFTIWQRETDGSILQGGDFKMNSKISLILNYSATTNENEVYDSFGYPDTSYAYVNMNKDQVTPDDVMVATRLSWTGHSYSAVHPTTIDNKHVKYIVEEIDSVGTELMLPMTMVYFGMDNNYYPGDRLLLRSYYYGMTFFQSSTNNYPVVGDDKSTHDVYLKLSNYLRFDWAPRLVMTYAKETRVDTNSIRSFRYPIVDTVELQNFAVINTEVLTNMHNVAILSLFDVPVFKSK